MSDDDSKGFQVHEEDADLHPETDQHMIQEDDLRKRIIGAAGVKEDQKHILGGSMMGKVSTALLARAFLPSPKDIKSCVAFLDLGIKFQIMLYEWSSTLFWLAVIEVSVFLFFQVLFLVNPKKMVSIYFHILHLPRGAIGLILVKIMPNSHDMLKEIRIPTEAKIPFSKIADQVMTGAGACVAQFSQKCQKLLLIFAGITVVTFILDLISFFRCINAYGSSLWQNAFADVSLLILATAFIFLDLFYFAWAFCTILKFPSALKKLILFGLCGHFKPIMEALGGEASQQPAKQVQEPAAK